MQIRIRHLLLLTIAVAVLFALFSWGTVGRIIIGITLFAIHFVVLTMPIVIFVLAIATSEQVGNGCDRLFGLLRCHCQKRLAEVSSFFAVLGEVNRPVLFRRHIPEFTCLNAA